MYLKFEAINSNISEPTVKKIMAFKVLGPVRWRTSHKKKPKKDKVKKRCYWLLSAFSVFTQALSVTQGCFLVCSLTNSTRCKALLEALELQRWRRLLHPGNTADCLRVFE